MPVWLEHASSVYPLSRPKTEKSYFRSLSLEPFLILSAVMGDYQAWEEREDFDCDKLAWLRQHYPYAREISRHDPINRVISRIGCEVFSHHFSCWISAWMDLPGETVISLK